MSLDFFKHLFEAIKLSPKYLIAIGLVLWFLLFAPAQFMQWIGVADLAQDYRQWFGIGFLGCVALLGVSVVQAGYVFITAKIEKWRFKRHMLKRLGRLTEHEKQILRFYIGQQTRSNYLRADDGVVQGLASSRIIYRASSMGSLVEGFAFNINELAWDVLNKDPNMLDGTTNTYRTDKRTNWMG